MFDRVLVESGQFLMKDDIELDLDRFKILVQSTLGTYSKYVPHHHIFNLDVQALDTSFGGLKYTFHEGSSPFGIPDWISDLIPVRLAGVHPWYFRQKEEWVNKELEYKRQFPWEYRRPHLYVPVQSIYEVTAVYHHRIKEKSSDEPVGSGVLKKNYEVLTIDERADHFFDLLRGRFLKALGRNRRAFTLNELPITVDAAELVSEGDQIEKDALEQLSNVDHKFWLAYR
jgi:hypothetical protein